MDVKTLAYFGLDELGTSMWREIECGGDADEAYRRALNSTGLAPGELGPKFRSMLEGLSKSGIIELQRLPPN